MQTGKSTVLPPQITDIHSVLGVSLPKLQHGGVTPKTGDGLRMEVSAFAVSFKVTDKCLILHPHTESKLTCMKAQVR